MLGGYQGVLNSRMEHKVNNEEAELCIVKVFKLYLDLVATDNVDVGSVLQGSRGAIILLTLTPI